MAATMTGPFFDERRDVILDRMVTDIRDTVGDQALVEWETNMELAIRHSGPIYQSFAHAYVATGPVASAGQVQDMVINDGYGQTNRLKYGPWLEGLGSRNAPVTSFPGYYSLRRAFATTSEDALELAEPIVDEAMEVMNGD